MVRRCPYRRDIRKHYDQVMISLWISSALNDAKKIVKGIQQLESVQSAERKGCCKEMVGVEYETSAADIQYR